MKNVVEKIKSIFNKMCELAKQNKKIVIACGIGLILIVAIVIIVIVNLDKTEKEITQEEKLTQYLEDMGKDFYENFYYQQIGKDDESRKAFLEKYKKIGIKVNIDNLSRYKTEENKNKIEAFVNDETGEKCNRENTKITIYPKEPYSQTDYDIELKLDCGFEEEK